MIKAHPSTDKCQVCRGDLRRYGTYYDSNTSSGHWAWMCRKCWVASGIGIGTGLGQEYDAETDIKLRG